MRPIKEGLEYFPLDVNADLDDKFQIIESKHGALAFGVIIKLFMKVYSEGYVYELGEAQQYLMAKRCNCDRNYLMSVVSDAVSLGIFSAKIFNSCSALTSHGIQKRFLAATSKRKISEIDPRFLLMEEETPVSDVEILAEAPKLPEETPQSKAKESKEKQSKEEPFDLVSQVELPLNFPVESLLEWLAYKAEKGQRYKIKGLQALIDEWAPKMNRLQAAVRHSKANNYQGLFENKSNGNNYRQSTNEINAERIKALSDSDRTAKTQGS